MSKTRSMYAGSSGSNYGVNKNSPGNGNGFLQGLASTVNKRAGLIRYIRTETGGKNRNVVFCVNQLGGVGKKSNMFASNADGVKEPCHDGVNSSNITNSQLKDALKLIYNFLASVNNPNTEVDYDEAVNTLGISKDIANKLFSEHDSDVNGLLGFADSLSGIKNLGGVPDDLKIKGGLWLESFGKYQYAQEYWNDGAVAALNNANLSGGPTALQTWQAEHITYNKTWATKYIAGLKTFIDQHYVTQLIIRMPSLGNPDFQPPGTIWEVNNDNGAGEALVPGDPKYGVNGEPGPAGKTNTTFRFPDCSTAKTMQEDAKLYWKCVSTPTGFSGYPSNISSTEVSDRPAPKADSSGKKYWGPFNPTDYPKTSTDKNTPPWPTIYYGALKQWMGGLPLSLDTVTNSEEGSDNTTKFAPYTFASLIQDCPQIEQVTFIPNWDKATRITGLNPVEAPAAEINSPDWYNKTSQGVNTAFNISAKALKPRYQLLSPDIAIKYNFEDFGPDMSENTLTDGAGLSGKDKDILLSLYNTDINTYGKNAKENAILQMRVQSYGYPSPGPLANFIRNQPFIDGNGKSIVFDTASGVRVGDNSSQGWLYTNTNGSHTHTVDLCTWKDFSNLDATQESSAPVDVKFGAKANVKVVNNKITSISIDPTSVSNAKGYIESMLVYFDNTSLLADPTQSITFSATDPKTGNTFPFELPKKVCITLPAKSVNPITLKFDNDNIAVLNDTNDSLVMDRLFTLEAVRAYQEEIKAVTGRTITTGIAIELEDAGQQIKTTTKIGTNNGDGTPITSTGYDRLVEALDKAMILLEKNKQLLRNKDGEFDKFSQFGLAYWQHAIVGYAMGGGNNADQHIITSILSACNTTGYTVQTTPEYYGWYGKPAPPLMHVDVKNPCDHYQKCLISSEIREHQNKAQTYAQSQSSDPKNRGPDAFLGNAGGVGQQPTPVYSRSLMHQWRQSGNITPDVSRVTPGVVANASGSPKVQGYLYLNKILDRAVKYQGTEDQPDENIPFDPAIGPPSTQQPGIKSELSEAISFYWIDVENRAYGGGAGAPGNFSWLNDIIQYRANIASVLEDGSQELVLYFFSTTSLVSIESFFTGGCPKGQEQFVPPGTYGDQWPIPLSNNLSDPSKATSIVRATGEAHYDFLQAISHEVGEGLGANKTGRTMYFAEAYIWSLFNNNVYSDTGHPVDSMPDTLTDEQAHSYLNNWTDLQKAFQPSPLGPPWNAKAITDAKNHWVGAGKNEGRNPFYPGQGKPPTARLSDAEATCYLNRYPSLKKALAGGVGPPYSQSALENAKNHWVQNGKKEGRNPWCNDTFMWEFGQNLSPWWWWNYAGTVTPMPEQEDGKPFPNTAWCGCKESSAVAQEKSATSDPSSAIDDNTKAYALPVIPASSGTQSAFYCNAQADPDDTTKKIPSACPPLTDSTSASVENDNAGGFNTQAQSYFFKMQFN